MLAVRSCPYCLGARLKFSQRSHDPKKGVGTRRLFYFLFLAAYAARDCFAAKSHSTTTQYHQLRRLAQCINVGKKKTECKGQVSSPLRLGPSHLKHSEVKRFAKQMHIIYLWERVPDTARARTSSAWTRNGERECLIRNYPESSLWTGSLKVLWLQRSVFKKPGIN